MLEKLNYFVELTVSIYFLCIYVLFVINVCEFMPLVDHNIYKDDVGYEPPKTTQVAQVEKHDVSTSKSGVNIDNKQTKSKTDVGSKKTAGESVAKIVSEGNFAATKPDASAKSVVSKQSKKSKQGSKTKVGSGTKLNKVKEGIKEPVEEQGGTTDEEDGTGTTAEDNVKSKNGTASELARKSDSKPKSIVESPPRDGGSAAENDDEEKTESQPVEETDSPGLEAIPEDTEEQGGATVPIDPPNLETDPDAPTDPGESTDPDAPVDPNKKPSKSPEGELASPEPNENPPEE